MINVIFVNDQWVISNVLIRLFFIKGILHSPIQYIYACTQKFIYHIYKKLTYNILGKHWSIMYNIAQHHKYLIFNYLYNLLTRYTEEEWMRVGRSICDTLLHKLSLITWQKKNYHLLYWSSTFITKMCISVN